MGIFPFQEARTDDYYYKLLCSGKKEKYWRKTGGEKLSNEFKDLMERMLNYDPAKRPTIKELVEDPWMKKLDTKKIDNGKFGKEIRKMIDSAKFDKSTQDTDSTKII